MVLKSPSAMSALQSKIVSLEARLSQMMRVVTIINNQNVSVVGASDYSASATDSIIVVRKAAGSPTSIILPEIQGKVYTIKDGKGDAQQNTITITSAGGGQFDGNASILIDQNHGSLNLVWTGSEWSVL